MRWTRRTSFLVLATALLAVLLAGMLGSALAQTDPPALGDGDWTIRDRTVIRDWGVIMLRGDLRVTDGGDLTLSNTTVLFVLSDPGEHGVTVDNGGSIRIVDGSTVGSSRPKVPFTFVVEAGCTLVLRDSTIEECGEAAFGLRPNWREVALYVGTADAVVERTSFIGGLAGLYFEEGVIASPVRNCTFVNAYGIISWGTSVEDCTFNDQTIYGVVFHGGTQGRISRCVFEGIPSTCLQIGHEYFEPYQLYPAETVVEDCTFLGSARGIRVLPRSVADISGCYIDGMEQQGIYVREDAVVRLVDGEILNASRAILCIDTSWVDWQVDGRSRVLRSNLTLTGNISLSAGAELELREIRNLTMLSHEGAGLWISLDRGASLSIVNGSIELPPTSTAPHAWDPVRIVSNEGDLELAGMSRLDLDPNMALVDHLIVRDTVIPLGTWRARRVTMEDCVIVLDLTGGMVSLSISDDDPETESVFERCAVEGAENWTASNGAWLNIGNGRVTSIDFLHDVGELMDEGSLEINSDGDMSRLDVLWTFQVHAHWQNQLPVPWTDVIVEGPGGELESVTTQEDGYTGTFLIMTEQVWENGTYLSNLPLEFIADVGSGLSGTETVETVHTPVLVDIKVIDLNPPMLRVDQGWSLAINSSTINITGSVMDAHSGVAFLEVAILPADYIKVPIDEGTGRFSLTLEIRGGYQTISLRAYDAVGNRVSGNMQVYYSTVSPLVLIDQPVNDSWVNSSLLYVVGQTEANSTVEAQGRVQTTENGTFRILVYLKEGPNLVVVNVTNPAGNHNSTDVTVYLDTKPPELVMVHPPHTPYSTNEPREVIRGVVTAGEKVFINSVSIYLDDSGSFFNGVSLDQGAKRYVITAMDLAGNTDTLEVVFILDSVPPAVVVLANGQDATKYTEEVPLRTSSAFVTITVSTEEGAYLLVGGEVVAMEGREGSVDHPLDVGMNTIMVHVEDDAGNFYDFGPINIEVDRTPPLLTIDPSTPNRTEEALFTLRGRTEDNVTLLVNGAPVSVDSEGAFQKNFLLNEGPNRIVITVTDRYGQTTTLTHDITMTPPDPEPLNTTPSPLPYMLALTALTLVVVAVVLKLWWKRQRAKGDWIEAED